MLSECPVCFAPLEKGLFSVVTHTHRWKQMDLFDKDNKNLF